MSNQVALITGGATGIGNHAGGGRIFFVREIADFIRIGLQIVKFLRRLRVPEDVLGGGQLELGLEFGQVLGMALGVVAVAALVPTLGGLGRSGRRAAAG
mgnify:CR=1 FL=1